METGDWGHYQGPYTDRLSESLQKLTSATAVQLCCSGTLAVELALRGLSVAPGDEVILAAYDFPGNFRAIEAVGATPVLADIAPGTWCIDPLQVRQALTARTRAVIVSHLHGGLADMEALREVLAGRQIGMVEDACQSPGATVQGRPAGSWGDVGVFSFGGSKLLTAGRGGAAVTNDADIAQRMRIWCERGNDAFALSQLQAAVLLPQLDKLNQRNVLRWLRVQQLVAALHPLRQLTPLRDWSESSRPAFYKLAFHLDTCQDRANWLAYLQAEGVLIGEGFRGFAKRSSRRCRRVGTLAHAVQAATHTLVLHHTHLLGDEAALERLAQALSEVDLALSE